MTVQESSRKETLMESETRANPKEQRKPWLDPKRGAKPAGLEVVRAVQHVAVCNILFQGYIFPREVVRLTSSVHFLTGEFRAPVLF